MTVGAGQVTLDRLEGDVQLAGDLAVGAAVGGQPGHAQLAGGQRVHPGPPRAPRAGAGRPELVADPGGQRSGAAAGRELERPGQRIPGRGALAIPAQGRAEFGQRASALEQRGGVVKRGRRLVQQGQALRAAAGQPGHPQGDPERARRAECPHVGQFGVGQPYGVPRSAQAQQRERGAGACVHVARLADRYAPHVGAEQLPAGLEFGQRLGGPALSQPQASAGRRDEYRPDARGPPLRRQQVQQQLRLVKLARLDGDVGKNGRGEPESRREVTLLQHIQRHPRRRVGLGQRAEPQLEQAEGGVGGHQAAGRTAAVNLLEHRPERRFDRAETLGHDQDPQHRRSRIPVPGIGAGPVQRLVEQGRDLAGRAARQQHGHRLRHRDRFTDGCHPARTQASEHGRDPWRAARVVQAADHQFALQPGRELLVGRTEFGQRPLDDVHRVHPPEQGRVGLGYLQRDLGPGPRACRHPQRLLQQHESPLPPGGDLSASRFPQDPGPLRGRRRLGQCPVQQVRRGLRRAAVHGRPRRLPQPRQYPAVTGGRTRTRCAATWPGGAISACSSPAARR